MADMHKEFDEFHGKVALAKAKRDQLKNSRNALRERIRKYFQSELELPAPKFRGQGSYSMGTTVNPLSGEFDIDDGVYLLHLDNQDDSEWPSPDTVHRWLVNATDGHTSEKPMDKKTCVRVRYAGQYHVDLPIYGELRGDYLLAEKGEKGWHVSDPLAITNWFQGKVNTHNQQLRRLVRYLKAWADFQAGRRGKMPSGLILTVLAAENFRRNDKDDIALADTARAIADAVHFGVVVYNPVDSTEELTSRLTEEQKSRFQEAISSLSQDAATAVDTEDAAEASDLWRGQFGDRFPRVESEVDSEQAKIDAAAVAVTVGSRAPKPWSPIK